MTKITANQNQQYRQIFQKNEPESAQKLAILADEQAHFKSDGSVDIKKSVYANEYVAAQAHGGKRNAENKSYTSQALGYEMAKEPAGMVLLAGGMTLAVVAPPLAPLVGLGMARLFGGIFLPDSWFDDPKNAGREKVIEKSDQEVAMYKSMPGAKEALDVDPKKELAHQLSMLGLSDL